MLSTTCVNTKKWNNIVISLKEETLDNIQDNFTYRDYLKYYRVKNNLTYNSLAKSINVSPNSLKLIEIGKKDITRDISKKLSIYFKLGTIHFYNNHFEETENIDVKIRKYRKENKKSNKEIALLLNVNKSKINAWSINLSYPNYIDYLKLKEFGII